MRWPSIYAMRASVSSDPRDEAAGVQDVSRIELSFDALHDPAGGAWIIPHGDLRLDRQRGPFEIRVSPAGAGHLAPLGEEPGERREILWNRIGRDRAAYDADSGVSRPGTLKPAPAGHARPLLHRLCDLARQHREHHHGGRRRERPARGRREPRPGPRLERPHVTS